MQVEQAEPVAQVFRVRGRDIPVYGKKLGQALFFILRRRNTAKPLPLLTP